MNLFKKLFGKTEPEPIQAPKPEVKQEEIKKPAQNQADWESISSGIFIIKGFNNEIDTQEIVDFNEHEEISEEAKKLTIDYINSLKGQIYYNHDKFYKLQESPYKCKDKAKTQVWLYNLIDYESVTVSIKKVGGVIKSFECRTKPELNTTDDEQLKMIAKELKIKTK